MTTTPSEASAQRLNAWSLVLLVVVLLLLIEFLQLASSLRLGLELVTRPFSLLGGQVVSLVVWPVQIARDSYRAHIRIQDLERRYSEALAQVGNLQGLKAENEHLRLLLTVPQSQLDQNLITTPIVSYGLPGIAAGSEQGLTVGSVVLINQTVVGRLSSVSPLRAGVELLHQGQEPWLLVKIGDGVTGIVKGNGRQILVTEVGREQTVQVGDQVVTLGQTSVERDLLVGVVSQIKTQPTDPAQTVVVEQLVSFFEARLVEVRK